MSTWSTRAQILCRANLATTTGYPIREGTLYVLPTGSASDEGIEYLVDLRHDADSVEDALVRGVDLIDQFLDALSIASYGSARRSRTIVSRPPDLVADQPADVAALHGAFQIEPIDVQPADIAGFSTAVVEDSAVARAVRYLRDGLNARSPVEAHWSYWASMETLSQEMATEEVKIKCPKCSAMRGTGQKRVMPIIGEFFERVGKPAREASRQRELRGKIVHGGSLKNVAAQDRVSGDVAEVEPAAVHSVAAVSGVQLGTSGGLVHGVPVTGYQITATAQGVEWRPRSFKVSAAFTSIPAELTRGIDRRVQLGIVTGAVPPEIVQLGLWAGGLAEDVLAQPDPPNGESTTTGDG